MSLSDPICFPPAAYNSGEDPVCAACFADDDLKAFIENYGEVDDCSFCKRLGDKTYALDGLVTFIEKRVAVFYGLAVNQMMYVSREGGYQGVTYDTEEVVFDGMTLELAPKVEVKLGNAIRQRLRDDAWCDYDIASLDLDDSLRYSWQEFCEIVKHRRRFFFTAIRAADLAGPDDRTPAGFLSDVAEMLEEAKLVRTVPTGSILYRARPRSVNERFDSPSALGPPPHEYALQANRMNPPGIPMFYGAESAALAVAEVRNQSLSLGSFRALEDLRVLDLAELPDIPGFFSEASRRERQFSIFLRDFSRDISKPVPRDDRVHVDYLPTQVFTEFLRDLPLEGRKLHGLRYPSAIGGGANLVLFGGPESVVGGDGSTERDVRPYLELVGAEQR